MSSRILGFAVVAFLGITSLGCGGKKGTIELDIVVSPLDDPFTFAAEARFVVGTKTQSVPVTNGHFDISIDQEPPKDSSSIVVDALDSAGNILGHGQTPALSLAPVDQGPFSVWVGRPGSVSAARAVLPAGRTEMAGIGAAGLGALFAGGRDATGTALANTAVYDVFTQEVIKSEDGNLKPMSTPRAGAAGVASSPRGIVFGGAQATGFDAPGGALASGELFDPSGGGIWAAVPATSTPTAAYDANTIVLGSGSGLISGGFSAAGTPVPTALLVSTTGTVSLTPLANPMAAARAHHAVGAAHFPMGDGALIVGGLADGDVGPIVERLVGQNFDIYSVDGIENRWDATATGVSGGVLLIGGSISAPGGRVASTSVVFIPTDVPGTAVRYDILLPTPRARHTATLIGEDILICGGVDATGAPIASCELVGSNPVVLKKTIPCGVGRVGHVAVQLETGPVLIAGGVDGTGLPINSIEIYTPEIATQ